MNSSGPEGSKKTGQRQDCMWGESTPCPTDGWKQGTKRVMGWPHTGSYAQILWHTIGRAVPSFESLCSTSRAAGKIEESKREMLTRLYRGNLLPQSCPHKAQDGHFQNQKYIGPSLGNVHLQTEYNWFKMKYFTLETYHSIRYQITLQERKDLMTGYYNIIKFEENSKTKNCPPFIEGFNLKEQFKEL